jgi:fumarate hydratase class II
MIPEVIRALAQVKRAAATVNAQLGLLDQTMAGAIEFACDEIITGKHEAEFPCSIWQTGSDSQTNMNVNEVIAYIAS